MARGQGLLGAPPLQLGTEHRPSPQAGRRIGQRWGQPPDRHQVGGEHQRSAAERSPPRHGDALGARCHEHRQPRRRRPVGLGPHPGGSEEEDEGGRPEEPGQAPPQRPAALRENPSDPRRQECDLPRDEGGQMTEGLRPAEPRRLEGEIPTALPQHRRPPGCAHDERQPQHRSGCRGPPPQGADDREEEQPPAVLGEASQTAGKTEQHHLRRPALGEDAEEPPQRHAPGEDERSVRRGHHPERVQEQGARGEVDSPRPRRHRIRRAAAGYPRPPLRCGCEEEGQHRSGHERRQAHDEGALTEGPA